MIERLEGVLEKYNEITAKLATPEILNDYNKLKELSKDQKDIEELVEKYQEYKKVVADIEETKTMLQDSELGEFAKSELINLEKQKELINSELEILLIPKDENDGKNVIMEIRGAAGGDEANIFAGDLFRMYSRYAEKNNWKIEIINEIQGSSGGFSQIEFIIKGESVYSKLKFESGSHRVQRVPATETQGRVHTSTATVAVMPEVEEINMEIKDVDIKTDVYRASGAGGQHVNTTDSAVRLTHIPTGIVVTCQTERSQIKNKERAMKFLKAKLSDELTRKQEAEIGAERKSKVGSGDRSEKIRTYNYPQNRVTDHRINFTVMELDRVVEGLLESIIEALIAEDLRLKLSGE